MCGVCACMRVCGVCMVCARACVRVCGMPVQQSELVLNFDSGVQYICSSPAIAVCRLTEHKVSRLCGLTEWNAGQDTPI